MMAAFAVDSRTLGNNVTSIPTPLGTSPTYDLLPGSLKHERVQSGSWHTAGNWGKTSHPTADVYDGGDVYFSNGAFSITLTLPPSTGAFYFYAQPFETTSRTSYQITATASDGIPVNNATLMQSVKAGAFAAGYGFTAPAGDALLSITITISGSTSQGFAVGEFGIAPALPNTPVGNTPEPATLTLLGLSAIGLGGGYVWRRRKEKPVSAV
jgi:hypothetical protein